VNAPAPDSQAPPRGDDPVRPLLLEFTSGTSGPAKAVLLTQAQLAGVARACAAGDRWMADDRVLTVARWPSKVALRHLLRAHAAGGALVNVRFPQTKDELARVVRTARVTALCSSATSARALLRSRLAPGETIPPLRVLRVTGAPLRPEELRALRTEITPNVSFGYGTTETGLIAVLPPEEPIGEALGMRIVVPGLDAQVVGESDQPLPAGTLGRLRYRAPWIPREYVDDPEASARNFRGGWFYPGDLGSIDAAGRIVLQGRADDAINFCGVMIVPREIEPVLARFPGIEEVVVIGVPDAHAGQLPVAFLVARSGVDQAALVKHCAHHFDPRRRPWLVRLRAIPRNAAGKIERERLIEHFRRVRGDNVAHG
jgi:acyl-coenzyme A synthetase/AMP-(fatty) acid ligase